MLFIVCGGLTGVVKQYILVIMQLLLKRRKEYMQMLVGGDIFVIAITGPRSSMFGPTLWINDTAVIP